MSPEPKVLLPWRVFSENHGVTSIVVETCGGACGILPHRLDCITALVPGILVFNTEDKGEVCMAVDEGILVKIGTDMTVSVRRAIVGSDLGQLHTAVEHEFLTLDADEQNVRSTMVKLESDFRLRIAALSHE